MKQFLTILLGLLAATVLMGADGCSKKEEPKTPEVMEDAAESVGDAMEDAKDGAEEMVEDAGDAMEDAADKVEDAVEDATE